ncbi:MAG: BatD family protein [Spirosomaceae bacterium]|nr:BatD family protein [Spirosomataceae bacterium]
MKKIILYILILIFFCTISIVKAQNVENPFSIELKGTNITIDEPFSVVVTVVGLDNFPQLIFPDLKNFQKRESSKSIQQDKIGGKTIVKHIITQNYYPQQKGVYQTGTIEVLFNNQVLRTDGLTIIVRDNGETTELTEILPQLENEAIQGAFLAVTVNKRQVFVQEGFNLRLSLLIADDNTIEMDFYEPEKQLESLLKLIKPTNCWEENFEIREIVASATPLVIRGKSFTEYRIYQASFFPLNAQPIRIPAVKWLMKVLPSKNGGQNTFQSFESKAVTVEVKNLPGHPLRNQVVVGQFSLDEKISTDKLTTGNSYQYDFRIIGEGNLQAIREPIFASSALFDVYPPEVGERVLRQNGLISGSKSFKYQLIPRQNGQFDLSNMVFWIYFDPSKGQYDTLHSKLNLSISGESMATGQNTTETLSSIYAGIEDWSTTTKVVDYQLIVRYIANFLIGLMLIGVLFIIKKK